YRRADIPRPTHSSTRDGSRRTLAPRKRSPGTPIRTQSFSRFLLGHPIVELRSRVRSTRSLAAALFEAQRVAEELQHMILKALTELARVRAGIFFERVRDAIGIQRLVQLRRIHTQAVLVADIERDCAIA